MPGRKKKEEKVERQKDKAVIYFDWRAKPSTIEDIIKMMFPKQDYYQRWASFLIRRVKEKAWAVDDWTKIVLEYLRENYYYEGMEPYHLEEVQALYEKYNEKYSATTRNAKLDAEFMERFGTTLRKYYMQYRRVLGSLVKAGILRKENGQVELSKRFLGWVKALYDATSAFYLGGVEDFEDFL